MPYGLLSTGFVEKPLAVILDEVAAAQRALPALGADWDTSAESPGGQINAAIGAQLASAWEAIGFVYRSRDARAASFAGLDAVCALTGTTRRAASKGTVTLTVNLNAGVTLPAGSIAHVAGQPSNRWVTTESVTNSDGAQQTKQVAAEAELAGFYAANASTITGIATPVTGWLSVTNASDAVPGAPAEGDPALRARREATLTAGGSSPVDAVRAALVAVSGVSKVTVTENATNRTVNGVPAKSLWCIVQGGTDAAVAKALWTAKAGGIGTHGNTTVTVTGEGGFTYDVSFQRPTTVNMYCTLVVVYDDATYVGDAAAKAAATAVTAGALAGATLRLSSIIAAVRALGGVVDCYDVALGRDPAGMAESNHLAQAYEVLTLADARVTVTRGYA